MAFKRPLVMAERIHLVEVPGGNIAIMTSR